MARAPGRAGSMQRRDPRAGHVAAYRLRHCAQRQSCRLLGARRHLHVAGGARQHAQSDSDLECGRGPSSLVAGRQDDRLHDGHFRRAADRGPSGGRRRGEDPDPFRARLFLHAALVTRTANAWHSRTTSIGCGGCRSPAASRFRSRRIRTTEIHDYTWSPDGRWLAYSITGRQPAVGNLALQRGHAQGHPGQRSALERLPTGVRSGGQIPVLHLHAARESDLQPHRIQHRDVEDDGHLRRHAQARRCRRRSRRNRTKGWARPARTRRTSKDERQEGGRAASRIEGRSRSISTAAWRARCRCRSRRPRSARSTCATTRSST